MTATSGSQAVDTAAWVAVLRRAPAYQSQKPMTVGTHAYQATAASDALRPSASVPPGVEIHEPY